MPRYQVDLICTADADAARDAVISVVLNAASDWEAQQHVYAMLQDLAFDVQEVDELPDVEPFRFTEGA